MCRLVVQCGEAQIRKITGNKLDSVRFIYVFKWDMVPGYLHTKIKMNCQDVCIGGKYKPVCVIMNVLYQYKQGDITKVHYVRSQTLNL